MRRRPVRAAVEGVVRLAARRPGPVLALLCAIAAAGAGLALTLTPSAGTDTLAGRSSASWAATERYRARFGDDAIAVLARGKLADLVLTADLGRLIELEGCLSGNAPRGRTPVGGARSPCAALARSKPVQVVYGPGTFINAAVAEIQDALRARLAARTAQARRAAAAARALARARGGTPAEVR